MRRRSGALHCETEEQLLELASNNQMGLYYNERPTFKEVKFQKQWTINEAQNNKSQMYQNFDFSQQEEEAKEQQKQLNRGNRYFSNCIVDKQFVRFSIQICIIAPKIEQALSSIINEEAFFDLFLHTQKTVQNCIQKHSTVTSSPNSNVFCLETTNVECSKLQHEKENIRMTPKNWLKQSKSDKMMELLIVKKHINLKQNTEMDLKKISIIHRIFIVNEKYIKNPLIQIYLQKCHYVIDARIQTLKQQNDTHNKSNTFYNKFFNNKLFLERDCILFNRGQFSLDGSQVPQLGQFRSVFHKIQERIGRNELQRLNDILADEKKESCQPKIKMRR